MLLNAAIDVVLIPRIGFIGGAIGTNIATLVYVGGHMWICQTLAPVNLGALARTLARGLTGALAMCAVLLAFGTSEVSVPSLAAGGILACVAYCLVMIGTGELSPAERRRVWDYVRRRPR